MKYNDLQVWQKAMDLVEKTYLLTRKLPEEEKFGLASQMQRAAVSIPSNIAEGYSRATTKDYVKFLYIAKGSNSELLTQLMICERIGYSDLENLTEVKKLSEEISKMLTAMILKLGGA
ncbi:MAG: four helix bundle protein [Acutalibacteraceae bacterium]|nr:four helix bundle protein [Acutalibacteraceae bacterium]